MTFVPSSGECEGRRYGRPGFGVGVVFKGSGPGAVASGVGRVSAEDRGDGARGAVRVFDRLGGIFGAVLIALTLLLAGAPAMAQAPAPTISALSTNDGPAAGGTSVTLAGTGFVVGSTSVTIGGTVIPAGAVTVAGTTSLSFTTPAHAAGNVAVTVTTPNGTSSAVAGGVSLLSAWRPA
ncbi:IPT/TIG domain-containing protein [Brevundimonas staleyi]|uniref:IPT/TIG domain-containing protein n=1 Tax=Brevundimonas staleyi TaxID=74326 RepID=A0ABW0FWA7_9CAUL